MHRFWLALCAAVVIGTSLMTAASAAPYVPQPTRFDRRVDAIPARTLMSAPPQQLVDPVRQRAARVLDDWHQILFFAWAGAQILAFAWLWRSGNAARLRDHFRRRMRSRIACRIAFGATLGALAPLAGLPFAFISYRLGFNAGLTEEAIGPWLVHDAFGMVADALAGAAIVTLALELVDRTRLWYLAFIAVLFAAAVGIVAVDPVALMPIVTPLRPATIANDVPVEIARSSARARTLTAKTRGIGGFSRIIIGDVLVAVATPPEIAYVVAHEDAHARHNDVLKLTLVGTLLLILTAAIAVLVSDRVGFRRDDDALSRLALVGALIGIVALGMFPLYNAYARGIEYRADEDARAQLRDPSVAVRLLIRRADDDLVALCYRRSSSWYFADHPAPGTRIAAMRGTADPCPH